MHSSKMENNRTQNVMNPFLPLPLIEINRNTFPPVQAATPSTSACISNLHFNESEVAPAAPAVPASRKNNLKNMLSEANALSINGYTESAVTGPAQTTATPKVPNNNQAQGISNHTLDRDNNFTPQQRTALRLIKEYGISNNMLRRLGQQNQRRRNPNKRGDGSVAISHCECRRRGSDGSSVFSYKTINLYFN